MKAYWTYTCEFGHKWTFFRDEDHVEGPQDSICPCADHPHVYPHVPLHRDDPVPFFLEAVTLQKERLLDVVQISIRPAARVVDTVTKQVGHEYEFYLVVTDLHAGEERQSKKTFTWIHIKELLDRFRNVSAEKAWRVLDRIDADSNIAQEIADQGDEAEHARP